MAKNNRRSTKYRSSGNYTASGGFDVAERYQSQMDFNNADELVLTNQQAYEKAKKYDEIISRGGYISQEDLAEYRNAYDVYIDTGNRLRNVFKYQGYQFTDADEADWATHVAGLNEHYQLVYDTYSPYADETAFLRGSQWNWQWRQQQYEDNKKRIEELKAQRDNLIPQVSFNPDSNVPLPFYDQGYLSQRRELESQIAELEKQNAQYERGVGDWAPKEVDDSYSYYTSEAFPGAGTKRDYKNPSLGVLSQTTDHGDRNQWYYDENGVYRDAYGNALETDEFGNWIDPRNADHVIEDKLGLFLNASEEERNRAAAGDWGINNVSAAFREGIEGDWTYLQDWEIDVYYAYLEESKEKAYQYLANMERELDRRRSMDEQGKWYEEYEKSTGLGKVGMNLMTVPANLLGGFGGVVSDASAFLRGEDINPYSTAHSLSNYTRVVRGATSEDLSDVGLLGDFYTMGDLYGAGMSILDTLAASTLPFGSVLLASSAAEGEAVRLYQEGASNEQIAFGAAAAGAAELIFESLSLGELEKIKKMPSPKTLGQFFKTILVQGGVEASEEVLTEIANTVSNAFIMGAGSDWQKLVDEQGAGALLDKTMDALHAGISGFLSGGGTSTFVAGSSVINHKAQVHKQNVSVGKTVMAKTGGVNALLDLAKKLNINTAKVKPGNASQVGQLYYAVSEAVSKRTRAALISKMKEKGVSEEAAEKISGVATTFATGGRLTKPEEDLLTASIQDKKIFGAMTDVLLDKESPVRQNIMQLGSLEVSQDAAVEDGELVDSSPLSDEEYKKQADEVTKAYNNGELSDDAYLLRHAELMVRRYGLEAVLRMNFDKMASGQQSARAGNARRAAINSAASNFENHSDIIENARARQIDSIAKKLERKEISRKEYDAEVKRINDAYDRLLAEEKASAKLVSPAARKADATDSDNSSDMDGKTFLESTGEEVKSISVKRIGKGGAVVIVNGGTEASLRDVSFGDERTHLAYSRVTSVDGMTAEAANKILNNPKAERFDFINEAIRAFQGGLRNESVAENLNYDIISADEARALFEEGRKAVAAQAQAAQKLLDEIYQKAKAEVEKTGKKVNAELRYADGLEDVVLEGDQAACAELAARMVPALRGDIVLYDGPEGGKMGYYKYGEDAIYLNVNAKFDEKSMMAFVLAHEMVHRGRHGSPLKYQAFADLLIQEFTKKGFSLDMLIQEQLAAAKVAKVKMTDTQAFEEVICDACQRMLVDTNAGRILAEWGAQNDENRGFLENLKEFLTKLFNTLRKAFAGERSENLAVAAFRALDKNVQDMLAEMYVDMTKDAAEKLSVIKAAGMLDKINATGDGGVRYSLVVKSRDGTVTLEDPTKISREKTLNYLHLSRMGRLDEKSYFPVAAHTPEIIIATLKNAGIDITDKPLAMQAKKAKQSQNNHDIHSSNGYIIRGHAMSANEILEVIDKLNKPEAIIQETERTAKVKIDGVTEFRYLPDAFVVFVHLESGKECVAVIEFDSTIDSNYIVKDGANDEYHTTITIFEPDMTRNGKPYDYYDYLIHKHGNYEIDIIEKNSNPKTAHGENLTTVSEQEFSAGTVPHPKTVVKQNSSTDSDGNKLSTEQAEYFAESAVRDENGNLLVMYHGTSRGGFTIFDVYGSNYGLFGGGSYFTSSRSVAQNYTKKGRGDNPQVYAVYLNIKNPLDMDAQADPAEWAKAFPDATFPESGTNEQFFRAAEEFFEDEGYYTWDAKQSIAESIQDSMGYDGITHIGGGRVNADGERHRVYIAFEQNQIKRTDNLNPTENVDIDRKLPVGEASRMALVDALEPLAKDDKERKALTSYRARIEAIAADEKRLAKTRAEISRLWKSGDRKSDRLTNLRKAEETIRKRLVRADSALLDMEGTGILKELMERKVESRLLSQRKKLSAEYQKTRKRAVSRVRETAEKRDAVKKMQALVLDCIRWIDHPKKDEIRCPDVLKKPLAEFLSGIDTASKQMSKGGDPTINDLKMANAMHKLAAAIERISQDQSPKDSEDGENGAEIDPILDGGYLDLPSDFVQTLREMASDITEMMSNDGYIINEMTAAEVRQLSQLIRTLRHAIREMGTLYANQRFANIQVLGRESVEFMDGLGEIEKSGGLKDFAQWQNALPWYAFKRFGSAGESIFEEMMDGQDKLAFLARELFAFQKKTWSAQEAKMWGEDVHTIELPSGGEITLTTADAMSIFCISRRRIDGRDHGMQHLTGGGVRVIGLQKGAKKAKDSRANLSAQDVAEIVNSLTDRQKEVATAIQQFMSSVCSEWGNEIFMKRFLTKNFTEQFYFPIESNDENLTAQDPSRPQSDMFRLLNISATKPTTPKANNQVIIRNIFDVFTNHATDMAKLNAFGMPLLDYMKWVNYRQKTENQEGQINVTGVRRSMNTAYGSAAWQYVMNLIKDVNGRPSDGGLPGFYKRMLQNAKTAMVGNNLRVATLQVTAYPRAGLVLSSKSLALGLTKRPGKGIQKAKKYCGIALWKSFGFYDTDIAKTMEEQIKGTTDIRRKMIEWSLKGAELGDAITWGALWNACEYEVAATKLYEVGSEEFYHAVALKLREVVYRTQVVDSILTRSETMRSKNAKMKELSSFMSEPTVSANILMDAGFTFSMEKRRYGSAKLAWKNTRGYITRAISVYAIGQLSAALVEALWDTIRSDEDDEEKWETYLKALGKNLVLDILPFNKIPIISEFAEAAMSMLGLGYFSTDSIASTGLSQAVSAITMWARFADGKPSNDPSIYKAIYKTMQAISSLTGIAAASAMRDLASLWNLIMGAIDEDLKIE